MTINKQEFKEMPYMCGTCPFFLVGRDDNMGYCTAFDKHKGKYANVPKRCKTLFDKAFEMGGDLVIVLKE